MFHAINLMIMSSAQVFKFVVIPILIGIFLVICKSLYQDSQFGGKKQDSPSRPQDKAARDWRGERAKSIFTGNNSIKKNRNQSSLSSCKPKQNVLMH